MLAKKDFSQIQDYVIQILPQLLREKPEITATIEGIIAHQFTRRDEFIGLLEEVKLLREDMNHQFPRRDELIGLLKEVKLLREDMDQRFELMDQKFEAQRKETERMNQRFELMDQKFEAQRKETEQQFKLMEQKFEAQRKETERMNQRFELMAQKFEAQRKETERQFKLMEQKFEAQRKETERRFDALREEMNQRFEQVDQRLDKQHQDILDVKRRVIKLESTVDRMDEKITRFDLRLNMLAGTLGTEKGQMLEEVFASALSYGLKNPDIKPESIQLRQKFVDTEGIVFLRKGKHIEVDIIAENGKLTVFEVKATPTIGDVDIFAMKVKLIQLQNPDQQVHGIIISPWANEEVKQCCTEYDLALLD
jgi:hypothetical protein